MRVSGHLERDPRFVRFAAGVLRPFLRAIFRYEVTGFENLPRGAHLLIANHNSGAIFETLALFAEWVARFGPDRPIYALAHDIAFRVAPCLLVPMGAVPATDEAAHQALGSGAALLIFPGGNWQTVRPFWRDGDRDFGGRRGWTRIALASRAPVVPVRIEGSHFINPMLMRSRWLSNVLVIPRLLRVRWYPVSVAQLLASALAGWLTWGHLPLPLWLAFVYFAFLFTPLWAVFPVKIRIHLGTPIATGEGMDADRLYRSVVDALAKTR